VADGARNPNALNPRAGGHCCSRRLRHLSTALKTDAWLLKTLTHEPFGLAHEALRFTHEALRSLKTHA
jgi:hypothetical protein